MRPSLPGAGGPLCSPPSGRFTAFRGGSTMKSLHRPLITAAALLLAAIGPARAQQQAAAAAGGAMPESYRALQLRAMEAERNMILHMIDSMPVQWFREKA